MMSLKIVFLNIMRNSFGGKGFELWKKFRRYQDRCKMRSSARKYIKTLPDRLNVIKNKEKITILFFVNNMGMWKYDGLVKLLTKSSRFDFLIVPFIYPQFNKTESLNHRNKIKKYCEDNELPFYDGYDFNLNIYKDVSWINPDIVIYTQPYNIGYKEWLIDKFAEKSIFIYTPYGAGVTKGNQFYDTYLANFAWRVFAGTDLERQIYIDGQSVNKENIVTVGIPIADSLKNPNANLNPWKSSNRKRLIWAPHHSIDDRYTFSSSNFERIAYDMLEYVKTNPDIEIALKPHPLLKERLYAKWGIEKTDKYFLEWDNLENGFVWDGEYVELFVYSDGLIHDCASFVCEYLLTGKPTMYINEDGVIPTSVNSDFGLKCFKMHYHGFSMDDIMYFIGHTIIKGDDPMEIQRLNFVNNELSTPNGVSVAQNMMNELICLVK